MRYPMSDFNQFLGNPAAEKRPASLKEESAPASVSICSASPVGSVSIWLDFDSDSPIYLLFFALPLMVAPICVDLAFAAATRILLP